jgi:hypothetical protein
MIVVLLVISRQLSVFSRQLLARQLSALSYQFSELAWLVFIYYINTKK